jgi:hypothetical protein
MRSRARVGAAQAALALVLVLASAGEAAAGGPAMVVGAAEDNVKQTTLAAARAKMALARRAGFRALRITAQWARGQTELSPEERTRLRMAGEAAHRAGITLYVSVYPYGSSQTPVTEADRVAFAAFAGSVARAMPRLRNVIVGNEPNLNLFWLPQFGPNGENAAAPAYVALLARTYDALKAVRPSISVIGGTVSPRGNDRPQGRRHTQSPTRFIPALGEAYRASGRERPLMDAFAFHPYPETSSTPPTVTHPRSTTVGLADYGKLVGLLGRAFDGTSQRGSTLPVLYTEFGIESAIPPARRYIYTGVEPPTTLPVDEARQARTYRQALGLAFCQPTVRAMFLFHTVDERDLNRLQTGVYYANDRPKSSLARVRAAVREVERGVVARCPGLRLRPAVAVGFPRPRTIAGARMVVRLTCTLDCRYRVRLVALAGGRVVATTGGLAAGRARRAIAIPTVGLAAGRYRIVVAARAAVNTGPTVTRASPPLVR